jgi:hypothetical protein
VPITDIDTLACSLANYFGNVRVVVSTRGLPGDAQIVEATVEVIEAALALSPQCPPVEGERNP